VKLRLALAILLLVAAVAPAGAQTGDPGRVAELQEAIGEASAAEVAALRELVEIRGRRAELDAAVAAFDRQIRDVEVRIWMLQGDVNRFTTEALAFEAQAADASLQLDAAQQRAEDAAAALYRGSDAPIYTAVLDADNVHDAYVGTKYLARVSDVRRADVDALASLKESIEANEAAAALRRDGAAAARLQAESERSELAGLRADQQAKRDEVKREESREQALIASIRDRKDEFTKELAALQAASNAISAMLASRQRGQTRASSLDLVRPVPGRVTSSFGARVHPVLGTTRMHNGVDLAGSSGTPIKAAAGGTVAYAGVRGGYGNTVIIDHGNQYATLYGHASSLNVSAGEKVSAGETIAAVGSTGLATGPHLHFEVRLLGVPVNPLNYL
jgi:murein DD-endopeptidase MepM/ murein hydrolase activator NlpD